MSNKKPREAKSEKSQDSGLGHNPLMPLLLTLQNLAEITKTTMHNYAVAALLKSVERGQNNHKPDNKNARPSRTLQDVLIQIAKQNPWMAASFRNYSIAEVMEDAGKRYLELHPEEAALSCSQLNHKLVVESRSKPGTFTPIDKASMIARFADQSKNARYPHTIFTFSHAHARNEKDLLSIAHGIAAVARDCFNTPLKEARAGDAHTPDTTQIITACEARGNFLLEGAALYRRLKELGEVKRTGKPDQYKEISPAARKVAKLILSCLVTNPDAVDIEDSRQIKEIFADGKTKLTLQPNAIRIAQSIMCNGYSKGGQVASDVARYLADELMAMNAKGQPIVDTRPIKPPGRQWNGSQKPLNAEQHQTNVRNIMRKIGFMTKASLEVEMSDYYKKCGVRRFSTINKNDSVAYENIFHRNYASSPGDELWVVDGTEHGLGHAADEAMGDLLNNKRGYLVDHPDVLRRMAEWYAPLFGKAALANLRFDDPKCVLLETVPNTSDSLFESHKLTMVNAMKKAGLRDIKIERNGEAGLFRLTAIGLPNHMDALDKLKSALKELRENAPGLVIAKTSCEQDIENYKNDVLIPAREHPLRNNDSWPYGASVDWGEDTWRRDVSRGAGGNGLNR